MFGVYYSLGVVFNFFIYFYFKIAPFVVFINVSAHDFRGITLGYRLFALILGWSWDSRVWSNPVLLDLTEVIILHFRTTSVHKILGLHFRKLLFWFRWRTHSRRLLILHLLNHRKLWLGFLNLLVDFMVDYNIEICKVGRRRQNLALNQILVYEIAFTGITFAFLFGIVFFQPTFSLAKLIFGRLLFINDFDQRVLVLLMNLHF